MVFRFGSSSSAENPKPVNATGEIASPDYLGHKPRKNKDVARIGRRPLICVGAGLMLVAGVMTYTMVVKTLAASSVANDDGTAGEASINRIPFLEKKPSTGIIEPNQPQRPAGPIKIQEDTTVKVPPTTANTPTARNPYEEAEFQMWQQREQEKQQVEQAKQTALKNALAADETVYTNNNQVTAAHDSVLRGSIKQSVDYAQSQQASVNIPPEPAGSYLAHTRVEPASPFELKAGTVIPSVMLGGINSDLPGQIMAQVSQNVYDSATGRYLIIPQGAKLIGNYDHQIVQGQNRVLVVWHRLIYPDLSTVNLETMPGADESGYAGFKDKVKSHFWPTFRNALMLSAITAGVQLAQPKATHGSTYSSQQMIAAAVGMQMNNLGMQTISRNLNQPPTIQIRPGYVFNVLINKDMILPPWQGNAMAFECELARR
jgi:type IV secretion system protein TrbI